jgi:hypothetical protein
MDRSKLKRKQNGMKEEEEETHIKKGTCFFVSIYR